MDTNYGVLFESYERRVIVWKIYWGLSWQAGPANA